MATHYSPENKEEDPQYIHKLRGKLSRRQKEVEAEMRVLQEEMQALHPTYSDSPDRCASYSPSRDARVTFAPTTQPQDSLESPEATITAAEKLLNRRKKSASDMPVTTSRRLTDYHERVADERPRSPVSPPATNGYLRTFMEAMREERKESSRQVNALIQALAGNRPQEPTNKVNKAIPQVQAMKEGDEYFQLFEHTQTARNNPRDAWASTLLPLLNPICKSLALSLPADVRVDYQALKTELLALARSQTEQSSKLFWERKKPVGVTWREEVATLTKLLRRCAPGPTAEEVRGQVLVEKLIQMLPRTIQAFVRERKPKTPSETTELISTYSRAHNITETEWELKDYSNKKTNFKQSHSQPGHGTNQNTKQPLHVTNQQQEQVQSQGSSPGQLVNNPKPHFKGKNFQQKKKDMTKVQCHNCKEYGHYQYQCVKVNLVVLPQVLGQGKKPPVYKQGKIEGRETTWCMDSGADVCFI